MKLSQFKFKLPEERIAMEPTFHRDDSKLMVVHKSTGEIEHRQFKEVLDYFDEGDAFLFNTQKSESITRNHMKKYPQGILLNFQSMKISLDLFS